MNSMLSWIDLTVVITYMAMMVGVGFYVYRKAPSFEEFIVAGRSMTTPVLVCTLASTYYGLEDLFGTSEFAYNDGVVANVQQRLGLHVQKCRTFGGVCDFQYPLAAVFGA